MALTDRRLLLFSTRRGREEFKEVQIQDINSIRIENGAVVEVFMKDLDHGDLRIPIGPDSKHVLPDFIRTLNLRLDKDNSSNAQS